MKKFISVIISLFIFTQIGFSANVYPKIDDGTGFLRTIRVGDILVDSNDGLFLTSSNAYSLIDVFSGANSTGMVTSAAADAGKFLRADGAWQGTVVSETDPIFTNFRATSWATLSGAVDNVVSDALVLSGRVDNAVSDALTLSGRVDNAVSDANVLSGRVDNAVSDANVLSGRVDNAVSDANVLSGRVDNAVSDALTLSGRVDNAVSDALTLSGRVDNAVSDALTLSGRVDNAVSDANVLSGRVDNAVSDALTLSGRVDNAVSDANVLSGRVDNAVSDALTLSGRVDNAVSDALILSGRVDNAVSDALTLSGRVDNAVSDANVLSGRVDNAVSDANVLSGRVDYVASDYVPVVGGTFTGAVYTTRDLTDTAPANTEFATAGWVRSLAIQGTDWYFSSDVASGFGEKTANFVYLKTDVPAVQFTNRIASPVPSSTYLAGGISTQLYGELRSPITFEVYMKRVGGNATTRIPVKMEVYYVYNGQTNQLGDWEAYPQIIRATTLTKYDFTVSFNEPALTNGGVYVIGYLKSATVSGAAARLDIVGGPLAASHLNIAASVEGQSAAQVAAALIVHTNLPLASGAHGGELDPVAGPAIIIATNDLRGEVESAYPRTSPGIYQINAGVVSAYSTGGIMYMKNNLPASQNSSGVLGFDGSDITAMDNVGFVHYDGSGAMSTSAIPFVATASSDLNMAGFSITNVATNSIEFADGGTLSAGADGVKYYNPHEGGTGATFNLIGPTLAQFASTEGDVTALGAAIGKTETRLDFTERNTALNAFRIAVNGSLDLTPMSDGFVDMFEDESGVDVAAGSNYTYNASGKYYSWLGVPLDLTTDILANFELEDNAANTVIVNSNGPVANGVNDGNSSALSITGKLGLGQNYTGSQEFTTPTGSITNDSTMAISFWFNGQNAGDTMFLTTLGNSTAHADNSWNLYINKWSSPGYKLVVGTLRSGALDDFELGSGGLNVAGWHHVAVSWDSTTVTVWIDGTKYTDSGVARSMISPARLTVGARYLGANSSLAYIDQYRIWDRVLTDAEAAFLYNSGNGTWDLTGGTAGALNMELISTNYYLTEIDPTEAKVVLMFEADEALTINTDVKGWVSDDGGATWNQSILSDYGAVATNMLLYDGAITNTTGAGYTNIKWRVTTHNAKAGKLHGAALQVRE